MLMTIHLGKKIQAVPSGGLVGRHRRVVFDLTVPGLVTILEFFEHSKQTASTNELKSPF
jgi:hypothetical protein